MELDDLKQAISAVDQRLEKARSLHLDFRRTRDIDRVRASLRPLFWGHVGQVALGVSVAGAVGPFWWALREQPKLMLAGIALHLYALLMIVLGARVLVQLQTLDLAEPVVAIQKRLARLHRSYLTTSLAVGVPWWLLWLPLAMVLSGVDLVARTPIVWLLANLAVGIVGIVGTLLWFRRKVDPERAPETENAGTGESIRSAQRLLAEIARFERE